MLKGFITEGNEYRIRTIALRKQTFLRRLHHTAGMYNYGCIRQLFYIYLNNIWEIVNCLFYIIKMRNDFVLKKAVKEV